MTMTTAIQRPLSRTLLAAGLAVVGTIASFTVTTTAAQAGGLYRATLATPVAEPRHEVLGTALWRCEGENCRASSETSGPANSCVRVVREFGPVTSFVTTRGEFTAEQLERCNASA